MATRAHQTGSHTLSEADAYDRARLATIGALRERVTQITAEAASALKSCSAEIAVRFTVQEVSYPAELA